MARLLQISVGQWALPRPSYATVSAVAHRWGFTHLGRFAAAYRQKYGVHPSETPRSAGLPRSGRRRTAR